jgi:hypothetical protein
MIKAIGYWLLAKVKTSKTFNLEKPSTSLPRRGCTSIQNAWNVFDVQYGYGIMQTPHSQASPSLMWGFYTCNLSEVSPLNSQLKK